MPKNQVQNLAIVCLLALVALLWLFQDYLFILIFAAVFALATYPIYVLLKKYFNSQIASFLLCLLTFLLILLPLASLITKAALGLEQYLPALINALKVIDMDSLRQKILLYKQNWFINEWSIVNNLLNTGTIEQFLQSSSEYLSNFFRYLVHFFNQGFNLFFAFVLFLFILFFFYRDGVNIGLNIKKLIPLSANLSEKIALQFKALATIYLINVVLLAIIQGISFALIVSFFDLPSFYLGLFFALASFIPLVGSALIWIPLCFYLFFIENYVAAVVVAVWSVGISSFLIDHYFRSFIINYLTKLFPNENLNSSTLLVILATLAGVSQFGILGLILGPLMACTSLALFQIYLQAKENEVY